VTDGGVELARRQLLDLVEVSGGAVEFLEERPTSAGVRFVISLDTSGLERGAEGIEVRARERFEVDVQSGFPFEPPWAWSVHRRWAGTPHVQWGRHVCLYAAPSVEWNPSDGIRGFVARLTEWIERGAAGMLDPDGQPLHPPAVYSSSEVGSVLVHADVGDRVPWTPSGTGTQSGSMFAWCTVDGRRVDVLEWVDQNTAVDRAFAEEAQVFDRGRPFIVMAVVLIPTQFGSEYPLTAKALTEGLAEYAYSRDELLWDLGTATLINRQLRKRQKGEDSDAAGVPWDENNDEDAQLFTGLVVGTPSRRMAGGMRLAHLAAWKLDSFSSRVTDLFGSVRSWSESDLKDRVRDLAMDWFEAAKVAWMTVMEARPEVTQRRDTGTPLTWLTGKRVLVLGCGALGGPVAEFCVRAGVAELTVADQGMVSPGILVRQPYTDADVGQAKARALAERLSKIRTDLEVEPVVGNVRTTLFDREQDLRGFDLVIDATADASVRSVIERARRNTSVRPPLVTMVIGHDAQRGLVTTSLPAAAGAGVDAFRKVALHACSGVPGWADVGDDFFPASPRTELFFPEPGCSAPTFVGSAAQTSALAGLMLNEALMVLGLGRSLVPGLDGDAPGGTSARATLFASAVRLGAASDGPGTSRMEWISDLVQADPSSGFEVRVSATALAEAAAEVRRGARVRGIGVETGGMLIGSFDDATGVVHVDRVAGPPPDSYLAEQYFQHGLEGVKERVDAEMTRTRGSSGFVGFWHIHPAGRADPSPTDEQGMAAVVGPDGSTGRALMMILGGSDESWSAWREGRDGSVPEVYARVVPRSAGQVGPGHPGYVGGLDLQLLPAGSYFRGGYGGRVRVDRGGVALKPGFARVERWWARFRISGAAS
jgi:integrative and conjugative element protein (TIGR02256 family)